MTAEHTTVLRHCIKRISRWRVPPNWSPDDWLAEMQAHGAALLCQADGEYDPSRQVPLQAFEYQRVIAGALTRYRQEWRYALRFGATVDDRRQENAVEDPTGFPVDSEAVRTALAALPETDQWLLKQLFWEERSEADVAQELGISQQAVNKRKRLALDQLGETIRAGEPALAGA